MLGQSNAYRINEDMGHLKTLKTQFKKTGKNKLQFLLEIKEMAGINLIQFFSRTAFLCVHLHEYDREVRATSVSDNSVDSGIV